MSEDTKILCKHCNKPLEWEDTIENWIGDGTFTEYQVWSCPHCKKEYGVEQEFELTNGKITSFEKI